MNSLSNILLINISMKWVKTHKCQLSAILIWELDYIRKSSLTQTGTDLIVPKEST